MSIEKTLDAVFAGFDLSAKRFCDETDGLYCEIKNEYKGEEAKENIKLHFADIYYNSFVVRFVYIVKASLNNNGILCCNIRFDKNDDLREIPLPLFTDYCGRSINTPMVIPCVYNETAMKQAFDCIGGVLKEILGEVKEIAESPERSENVWNSFAEEFGMLTADGYSDDMFMFSKDYLFYTFLPLRLCTDAFQSAVRGNMQKAVKKLRRLKEPMGYESRLLEMWSRGETPNTDGLTELKTFLKSNYTANGVEKVNKKELAAMIFSTILLSVPFSAVFFGLYLLLARIESGGAEYVLASSDNYIICFSFGLLLALAFSYFTRKFFYKLIDRKNYDKYVETTDIQNGSGSDRLMKVLFAALFVTCLITCLLMSKWNINFMYDGFVDNSKLFSLKGEYYSYSEIEEVRCGFENENDFPSAVIKLKNSTEIDTAKLGYIEYIEAALSYLEKKGVKVERSEE